VPINLNEISPETPFNPCLSEHGITQIVTYGETTQPFRPIPILCDIDEKMARVIEERAVDLPGVAIEIESVRDYPTGSLTAASVGFLGPIPAIFEDFYVDQGFVANRDKVGYAGIELEFQELLGGNNGLRTVEVDVAGQILRDIEAPIAPVPGANIYLTIDTRLQTAATAIVEQELEGWNNYLGRILSNNAVAIAMNPQTGEVLALVSYPTYENNRFARIIPGYYYNQLIEDLTKPLLNHAISAEHPPGSVFKIATALGALNEGVVTPDQVLAAPPALEVAEAYNQLDSGRVREFVDWNEAGFGSLNFREGVANSSNVYFYKLAGGTDNILNGNQNEVPNGGLGICRLKGYAEVLGYGSQVNLELPGEEDGLLPDPKWKRVNRGENWSIGDMYNAGVGQGYVLSTPLQVLMSGAVIANDGKMIKPTIISDIIGPDGESLNYLDDDGNEVIPGQPIELYDLVTDPIVTEYVQYTSGSGQCQETGVKKTIDPWVFDEIQAGMRLAVTTGTLVDQFENFDIAAAGKTGTAEYCDNFAQAKNLCIPGNWPTHAWTIGYAPFDNPEIVVVAFVYNGGEGASVAGPIVQRILQSYFGLKSLDPGAGAP
jgi:penicillin-binding protein 2